MTSKVKSKKPALDSEKSNKGQQHGDANGSSHPVSHGSDNMGGGEESVSLTVILREIRDFRQDSKKQFEDIKGEITKTNSRLDEAEARIMENEERLQNAEEALAEMLTLQEQFQLKLADQEGRARRENVRIYGVPEGVEDGPRTMISFVDKLLKENLGIPDSKDLQIERAHRALAPQPPAGAQPRSILVKFLSFRTKEEVLKLAWQKKGFMWKNCKINLDQDYAPFILTKRREYAEARKALKEKNIKFQTLYPARLRVHYEDGTKTYNTAEEATSDLAARGLPVKVITQPVSLLERIQRRSWLPARAQRATRTSGAPGYKEKLQVFRRDQTEDKD